MITQLQLVGTNCVGSSTLSVFEVLIPHSLNMCAMVSGEEPTYAGVAMSYIIESNYGIGDVISLLWFKRSLPRYCTKFIEVVVRTLNPASPCPSLHSGLLAVD